MKRLRKVGLLCGGLMIAGAAWAQDALPDYLIPIHGTHELGPGFSADGPLEFTIAYDGEEDLEERLSPYGSIYCSGTTTVKPTVTLNVQPGVEQLVIKTQELYGFSPTAIGVVAADGEPFCDSGTKLSVTYENPQPGHYTIWIAEHFLNSGNSALLSISESDAQ